MYIYHFNKQSKFCQIAPTEELHAKMYLHFLDLFIKMCLMVVRVNRKCCVGERMSFVCDTCTGI